MATIQELFDLSGRVAVVTGSGTGIGFDMATGLAEAGASVVVCARRVERCREAAQQLSALGVRTLALRCDVTNPDEVKAMVEATLAEFGQIDILVNNAGTVWAGSPEDLALADWEKVLKVNVTGVFLCSQAVGRHMIQRKRGRIINIASVQGLVGKDPKTHNTISYAASKGAVINFTRDLAIKWAPHNIQVNALAPGFFVTNLNRRHFEKCGADILATIPMGRVGEATDLKGAAVFLASDAASYVTGHTLVVDGGMVAW